MSDETREAILYIAMYALIAIVIIWFALDLYRSFRKDNAEK